MTESTLGPSRFRLAAIIAEARRRGRRRKVALASCGLLALLVGGAIWAGLALSSGGGGAAVVHAPPGFHVVQAKGPVAHQIVETWISPPAVSVDLSTGNARPLRTTREIWYDSRGNASRFVDRADGRVQSDHAQTCPHSPALSLCFPGFSFQSYWPLDKTRYTRRPRVGSFRSHPVIWIAPKQPGGFPAYAREGERIGLDPRTHEPVVDRTYANGKVVSEKQVLARKPGIGAPKYAFVVANPTNPLRQPPAAFSSRGSDPFALRARTALGRTPLWLGSRFQGQRLKTATIGSTFGPPTGNQPEATPFVQYDYGNVAITEFGSRSLYGRAEGGPIPGRVSLVPAPYNGANRTAVAGLELTRGGLFVMAVKSHPGHPLDRAAALHIAHALRPVPLP